MDYMLIIGCVICGLALFTAIRDTWLFHVGLRMSEDDPRSFSKLPAYGYILVRFWVWDLRKFIRN